MQIIFRLVFVFGTICKLIFVFVFVPKTRRRQKFILGRKTTLPSWILLIQKTNCWKSVLRNVFMKDLLYGGPYSDNECLWGPYSDNECLWGAVFSPGFYGGPFQYLWRPFSILSKFDELWCMRWYVIFRCSNIAAPTSIRETRRSKERSDIWSFRRILYI